MGTRDERGVTRGEIQKRRKVRQGTGPIRLTGEESSRAAQRRVCSRRRGRHHPDDSRKERRSRDRERRRKHCKAADDPDHDGAGSRRCRHRNRTVKFEEATTKKSVTSNKPSDRRSCMGQRRSTRRRTSPTRASSTRAGDAFRKLVVYLQPSNLVVLVRPMTGTPIPTVGALYPMSGAPGCTGVRTIGVVAVGPDVAVTVPAPIPTTT